MSGLSALSLSFVIMFYAAAAVFIFGLAAKVYGYAVTPAPLKIPTTPAPATSGGVALRMASEIFLFSSLFKGNKWTWIGGYAFHVTFALVIFRHLRYFLQPVPEIVSLAGPPGVWAGVLLAGAAGYLFVRRIAVDRVKYISSGADYFALILIGSIAATGLIMKFLLRADVASVKSFMMGIVTFSPVNMPADAMFIVHLLLVMALMVYFPFSKLVHMGGIFFSPTRNQVDDCREHRHVNPWAA
ncbi:MAG: respiratory nitrate reductase subunit gamma [Nitrospinae bacterium]|nr:respiratory nitrate reductase subunit gamma [Nitrospinota bacterium]